MRMNLPRLAGQRQKRKVVRLLLLILSIPTTSTAAVLEDCLLKGTANGKHVALRWIYDGNREGFTMNHRSTYGFCSMEARDQRIYGLGCAESNGGKKTVHYESTDNGESFVCNEGCGKSVARTLNLKCKF